MVICFEEKDRAVIEGRGTTIIEYKRQLYKMRKTIDDDWKVLKELVDNVIKSWNVFIEKFLGAVDSVELAFEQIREAYNYPTSRRYQIVKVFSKCTGIDIRFCWRITWRIKRWLARRYC